MNIVLIGFKNCGKSSVGAALATQTKKLFVDTDRLLEQYSQETQGEYLAAHEIYRFYGEAYFRALETEAIATLADIDNAVIACGGGTIVNPVNVEILQSKGQVFYLDVPVAILMQRHLAGRKAEFLDCENFEASFQQLFLARQKIYEAVADQQLMVAEKTVEAIVVEIMQMIGK